MQNLTITISSDEDGYFYDIYDCEPNQVDSTDSLDGGMCTTTLENALDMAHKQALDAIKAKKDHVCGALLKHAHGYICPECYKITKK